MIRYHQVRYFSIMSLCIALLACSSLIAVKRDHVLLVETRHLLPKGELSAVIAGIEKAEKDVNKKVIDQHNAQMRKNGVATRDIMKFHEEPQLHMTLAYIGIIDDKDPRYHEIINEVKKEVRAAIQQWAASKESRKLDLQTENIMWPAYGKMAQIWLVMGVRGIDAGVDNSLLALINTVQMHLDKVQKRYGQCFEGLFSLPKQYKSYSSLNDFSPHISLGRLYPAYATFMAATSGGNIVINSEGRPIRVNAQGEPLLVPDTSAKYFMMDLNATQQRELINILQVQKKAHEHIILPSLKLAHPHFTVTQIELSSKSKAHAHDVKRLDVFMVPTGLAVAPTAKVAAKKHVAAKKKSAKPAPKKKAAKKKSAAKAKSATKKKAAAKKKK